VSLLTAAILGVVQGLTEFLPVSSTAHLLIGSRILGFKDPGGVFTVTIQFGSILAVMWLYRTRILSVVRGLGSDGLERRFAVAVLAAFIPAVVAGLLFEDFVKGVLYQSPRVVAAAFIAGGVVMLLVERWRPVAVVHSAERAPVGRAVVVGLCQTVALIPGVSRSGATIVGGMLAGFDRAAAAEFSFFLAMPTIAGAFAKDLWEVRHLLSPERGAEIAVGFLMAFLAAAVVVGPFIRFVARAGFGAFAWYRIAAGVALYAAAVAGWTF
jgi:undecaprenyl-diphosphatase